MVILFLSACGGGGGETEAAPDPEPLPDDPTGSEPLPRVLELLKTETDLIFPVPDIAFTQTLANTGLQVSYTTQELKSQAPGASIEAQWIYMLGCVKQSAVAPLVIVREGMPEPFTIADDVVRNEQITETEITSVPVASASILYGPVIQISVSDFDGSQGGVPLFNLRSIMGRYLWLSNNLAERDYPFACAQQQP